MKPRKPSLDVTEDDRDLFLRSVADARPLRHDRVFHATPRRSPRRHAPLPAELPARPGLVSNEWTAPIAHEAWLDHAQGGLSPKRLRQLRQGKLPVEARLDLHGLTLQQADVQLSRFIDHCLAVQITCTLVVHGKGYNSGPAGPVLKSSVNRWLQLHPATLAFCSAQPRDGGTGAVYLLLRRATGR